MVWPSLSPLLRAKWYRVFPADCLHQQIFTALRRVLLDPQMFQHLARLLARISLRSPPFLYFPVFLLVGRMGAKSRIAPHQNYPPRTVPCWIPTGLDITHNKSGISYCDSTPAETDASKSPTYATHAARNANTK